MLDGLLGRRFRVTTSIRLLTLRPQLFTYALGRGPEYHDTRDLRTLYADWRDAGLTLRELVSLIVLSRPFLLRRAE